MRIECFVSYTKDDQDIAIQIIETLESENIEPCWDEKISLANGDLSTDIQNAIFKSQCFLVIWTENSIHSKWVINENLILHGIEHCNDKIVSVAINDPLIPPPFNTNQILHVQIKDDRLLENNELERIIEAIKLRIGIIGKNEHIISPRVLGENWGCHDLAIEGPVPGSDLLLSFRPCGASGTFLLMHFDTTDGWVNENLPSAEYRHRFFEDDNDGEYIENDQKYLSLVRKIRG